MKMNLNSFFGGRLFWNAANSPVIFGDWSVILYVSSHHIISSPSSKGWTIFHWKPWEKRLGFHQPSPPPVLVGILPILKNATKTKNTLKLRKQRTTTITVNWFSRARFFLQKNLKKAGPLTKKNTNRTWSSITSFVHALSRISERVLPWASHLWYELWIRNSAKMDPRQVPMFEEKAAMQVGVPCYRMVLCFLVFLLRWWGGENDPCYITSWLLIKGLDVFLMPRTTACKSRTQISREMWGDQDKSASYLSFTYSHFLQWVDKLLSLRKMEN